MLGTDNGMVGLFPIESSLRLFQLYFSPLNLSVIHEFKLKRVWEGRSWPPFLH